MKRLELGVPEAALWFADFGVELTRGELLRLWERGFGTPERIAAMTADQMEAVIGPKPCHESATLRVGIRCRP
ncbi:MAG TPA: hypothetical protein VGC14_05825 [Rhizobium sp.]